MSEKLKSPKICIYLKPSLDTILTFKDENILPISPVLGFHSTIHHIDYVCNLAIGSTEEEFGAVLKSTAKTTKHFPQIEIKKIKKWNHPIIMFGRDNELVSLHEKLGLRFVLSGILINNTYANVNPYIFKSEHGDKPNGYNPHISISHKPKKILKEIEFQPVLFSRVKTTEGLWEEEVRYDLLK